MPEITAEEKEAEALAAETHSASANPNVPKLYINGFNVTLGAADVTILLKHNDQPMAVVSTSYPLAKTLVVKLAALIASFEDATEMPVLTTDEVRVKLEEKYGAPSS